MTTKLTAARRRSVDCPTCLARKGEACRGSRIPGPGTLGGGWGGPPPLRREHPARVAVVREMDAPPGAQGPAAEDAAKTVDPRWLARLDIMPPLTERTAWVVGEWPMLFDTADDARNFARKVGTPDQVREIAHPGEGEPARDH